MSNIDEDDMSAALVAPSEPSDTASYTTEKDEGSRYDRLERLKREKRLAMNRECARVRRRRKKMRMELLEGRVQDLATANGRLLEEKKALVARVTALEVELNKAKAQQALRVSAGTSVLPSSMDMAANFFGKTNTSAVAAIERAEKLRYLEMLQQSSAGSRRSDPPAISSLDCTEALFRINQGPILSSSSVVKPQFSGLFF